MAVAVTALVVLLRVLVDVEHDALDEEHKHVPEHHQHVRQRVLAVALHARAVLHDVRQDVRQARAQENAAGEAVDQREHAVHLDDVLDGQGRQPAHQGQGEDASKQADLQAQVRGRVDVVVRVRDFVLELARRLRGAHQQRGAGFMELRLRQESDALAGVVVQDLLDGQHVRRLGRHGDLLSLILRVRVPRVRVVRRGERSLARHHLALEHLEQTRELESVHIRVPVLVRDVMEVLLGRLRVDVDQGQGPVLRVRVPCAGGERSDARERDQQEERGGARRERGAARGRDPSGGAHRSRSSRNARRPRRGGRGEKRRVRLVTLAREARKRCGARVRGAGKRAKVGRGGGSARVTM